MTKMTTLKVNQPDQHRFVSNGRVIIPLRQVKRSVHCNGIADLHTRHSLIDTAREADVKPQKLHRTVPLAPLGRGLDRENPHPIFRSLFRISCPAADSAATVEPCRGANGYAIYCAMQQVINIRLLSQTLVVTLLSASIRHQEPFS